MTNKNTPRGHTTVSPFSWITEHKLLAGSIAVVVLITAFVLYNTFTSSPYSSSGSGLTAPTAQEGSDASYTDDAMRGDASLDADTAEDADATNDPRKVIRNASLSLIVTDTEDAIARLRNIATRYSGFISDLNARETRDDTKEASVDVRIPQESFDPAIEDIKTLAINVENERISTRDVTEQFVDMEARLKAKRAEETQYVRLLDQAENVEEILEIRRELNNVREEIERLESRLTHLEQQVNMATISVSLESQADVEIFGITWSPIKEIKTALRDMMEGLISFANILIAFIFWIPVILLWLAFIGLILWILWRSGRFAYRRFF